ncbi:MAG: transposase [Gemmataceae bacterium]
MSRKTKRVLTDEQWRRIAPYLPQHPPSPKGGRPRADDRECLEGLLWLLRSGARWQDIPVELLADATFIRAKKGVTTSARPRLARA